MLYLISFLLTFLLGFECHCPFGLQGSLCDEAISIQKPYFDDEAYFAVAKPTHILRA